MPDRDVGRLDEIKQHQAQARLTNADHSGGWNFWRNRYTEDVAWLLAENERLQAALQRIVSWDKPSEDQSPDTGMTLLAKRWLGFLRR